MLVLLLGIAPGLCAQTAHSGAGPRSRLEGKWQAKTDDEIRNIMVRGDSSAQFGDQVARWRMVGDSLWLTLGDGVWQVYGMKLDGDKLTGSISAQNDTNIEDGKLDGDQISFKVTREFNGNKVVMKYSGKIDGDAIKGKIESERDGQPTSRDWNAKRAAAK